MDKRKQPILTSLNRGKLTELVTERIKELIFDGSIHEGEKLPSERELADQLEISRSVVREALSSLEHLGLVEIRRGRGAGAFIVDNLHKPLYHSTVNMMQSGKIGIDHFIEARKAIECYSLRQIADRITKKDLRRLEEIDDEFIKQFEANSQKDNAGVDLNDKAQDANTTFHLTLSEFSGNPLLTMMLHSLLDLMKANRHSHDVAANHFKTRVHHVHREIIEAMRKNDWVLAEECLVKNINSTKDLYLKNSMVKKHSREGKRRN